MTGKRHMNLVFAQLAAAVVLLTACSAGEGRAPTAPPSTKDTATVAPGDRAGLVDIGDGREIYLTCEGTGSPTVMLVSGLGGSAEVWRTSPTAAGYATSTNAGAPTVFDGVAAFTRVCAYDRPGTSDSRSTGVPQPTSARTSAYDLEALLIASGEAVPLVLVGHSYGGPIIRMFAATHPDQVEGMVLVDALSEDLATGLTAEQHAVFQALNAPPSGSDAETFDTTTVFADLRSSSPAPVVPVTVLTADTPQLTPELLASGQLPPGVDQEFADALWAAQMAAQQVLATKFPGALHVTATASDHYIQLGNPQLVIDSIREVVDEAG